MAKRLNFPIGTKFGRLTVIGEPEEQVRLYKNGDRKVKYYYYPCKCECGKEITAEHYALKNGMVQSCGGEHTNKYHVGAIFGDYEIIGEEDNKDRKICKCIHCGHIRTIWVQNLPKNLKCKKHHKHLNLLGQVFGELTVLSHNKGTKTEPSTWTCQCSCGNTIDVPGYALRRGNYKSCRCKRYEKRDKGLKQHIEKDKVNGTRISSLTSKPHKDNKLGVKGVIYMPTRNKYKAYIGFKGKNISLGHFDKLEDAIAARKAGEEKYHKPILEETKDEK